MVENTTEPVAIDAMTLAQGRERLAAIRVEISKTSDDAKGDMIQDRLTAERKKVNARIQSLADEAESGSRAAAIGTMNEALGKAFDFKATGSLLPGVTVSGTYRKTDTGWDDLAVGVGYEGNLDLLEAFHKAFPLDSVSELASVRGVSFQINRDGAKVEYIGKAPKAPKTSGGATGGSGGRGHGWTRNGGTAMQLAEAFNEVATDAEKAKHEAIATDPEVKSANSAQWSLKKKVVEAAGFKPAA